MFVKTDSSKSCVARVYEKNKKRPKRSFLFVSSFNEVIQGNAIIIGKFNCRPERKLSFSALIPLINGELHVEIFCDLPLSFVVILAQITDASVY